MTHRSGALLKTGYQSASGCYTAQHQFAVEETFGCSLVKSQLRTPKNDASYAPHSVNRQQAATPSPVGQGVACTLTVPAPTGESPLKTPALRQFVRLATITAYAG